MGISPTPVHSSQALLTIRAARPSPAFLQELYSNSCTLDSGTFYASFTATSESGSEISHQRVCVSVALCPLLGSPMTPFAPLYPSK